MKRYRSDKSKWELFIFAVCIKMMFGDSCIRPDVKSVRKLLGCSYYKAERLIERAKSCPELFAYYERPNLLVARSFTHGILDRRIFSSRHNIYTAYTSTCYKFVFEIPEEVSKINISHIEISRKFKDLLMLHAIECRQNRKLKDGSHNVVLKSKYSTRSNRKSALSVKKLGRISGYSCSTVSRHISKLEKAGEIKVTRHNFIPVADFRSGIVIDDNPALRNRRTFLRHGLLVVRDANDYVCDGNYGKFIIFNHVKRHRKNINSIEKKNESREEYLNRILGHLWN